MIQFVTRLFLDLFFVECVTGAKLLAALARAGVDGGEGEEDAEDGAVREFGNTYTKANKKGGKKKEMFFLDLTGPAPADMEKKMSMSKAAITLANVKGAKVGL